MLAILDEPRPVWEWNERAMELPLAERERKDDVGRTRIARWSVACRLRSLGRTEEALAGQQTLAAELEAIGETDEYVTEEIAECLRALGRT